MQSNTIYDAKMRVLLVEDDDMMGHAVKIGLTQAGHAVDLVESGEDAEHVLGSTPYDLVVLDVNLPGKSGLEVLKGLRNRCDDIPVLMLTARDTVKQKIEGLDTGADDYLVKPFDLDELLSRLNALFRRSRGRASPLLQHGNIACDPAAKTVKKNGVSVNFSAREFAVLLILLDNIGKIVSKRQIEDKLYGWDIEIDSNTVEVHISSLRKKLDDNFIKTVRGMGYIVE